MKAMQHRILRGALGALVITALAAGGAYAAKGGKPGKPGDPPPEPPLEYHFYRVSVAEFTIDESGEIVPDLTPVFWGDDPLITGRLDGASDRDLQVNMNAGRGINPYLFLGNLDSVCPDGGDWGVCFPATDGKVQGTLLMPASGDPEFKMFFSARSRVGKPNASYSFLSPAAFVSSDDPAITSWDLYPLAVGNSIDIVLTDWTLAASQGPVSKNCSGCGTFEPVIVILTVTRIAPEDRPPAE